jgi:hypothetical protein
MRAARIALTCIATVVVALAGPLSRSAAADDSAAHALADKFSRAAEEAVRAQEAKKAEEAAKEAEAKRANAAAAAAARRRVEQEQRAADEADMLRRAQAEAEERRAAEQRAFEEQERIEAEQEKARIAAEQEKARAEAEHLAQEAEERRQEDARRAEEARKAEAERLAREVEEKRRAEEEAKAEEQAKAEEAARLAREAEEQRLAEEERRADEARAKLEAMRMEEARRIAEKFRQAREARERDRDTRHSLGGPPPPEMDEPAPWSVETEDTRSEGAPAAPTRVTVLLIVEPRRYGHTGTYRTANPVLCFGRDCYISSGSQRPAEQMSRWKALGPANSIGRRAGPCRNRLACVFRNVALGGPSGAMQPVDMGLLRHDRHDIKMVRADRTCDVVAGRLFCGTPVIGHRYRAWVVPESIAAKAGPHALEKALEDGLPAARSAEREAWPVEDYALPTR